MTKSWIELNLTSAGAPLHWLGANAQARYDLFNMAARRCCLFQSSKINLTHIFSSKKDDKPYCWNFSNSSLGSTEQFRNFRWQKSYLPCHLEYLKLAATANVYKRFMLQWFLLQQADCVQAFCQFCLKESKSQRGHKSLEIELEPGCCKRLH